MTALAFPSLRLIESEDYEVILIRNNPLFDLDPDLVKVFENALKTPRNITYYRTNQQDEEDIAEELARTTTTTEKTEVQKLIHGFGLGFGVTTGVIAFGIFTAIGIVIIVRVLQKC